MGHHDGVSSDDEQNQSEIMKFNQERGGDLYLNSHSEMISYYMSGFKTEAHGNLRLEICSNE